MCFLRRNLMISMSLDIRRKVQEHTEGGWGEGCLGPKQAKEAVAWLPSFSSPVKNIQHVLRFHARVSTHLRPNDQNHGTSSTVLMFGRVYCSNDRRPAYGELRLLKKFVFIFPKSISELSFLSGFAFHSLYERGISKGQQSVNDASILKISVSN